MGKKRREHQTLLSHNCAISYHNNSMEKRLSNSEVATILKEVLAAMEVKEVSRFRIRAYQNAIAAIESSTFSVYDLWKKGRIGEIPGVGSSLAQHLDDLFTKGSVESFVALKKGLPVGMFELIGIQGIGPKKAFKLASAFKLENRKEALEKVARAAGNSEIRDLPGFGEKTEAQILESIQEAKKTKNEKPRLLWYQADQIIQRVYSYMRQLDEVLEIEALGSYRRKKETVGDADFAVSTNNPEKVMEHFLKFPEIEEVLVEGDKKASVIGANGFQMDIRVVSPSQYGSMVQYFTGSKYHNISLRTYALENGYSVSEYGITDVKAEKLHEFSTEEDFYKFLGLSPIPPEIRQGKEEVFLASRNELPKLVELLDIKGDIHTHTTFSDGLNTLEEMVEAGIKKGYEYIGIADHAPSIQRRGYEDVRKLIESERKRFDVVNKKYPEIEVLYGYEVNILADATLGLPDELLEKLDYVIAGVHTSFIQSRERLMGRMMAAIENPFVDVIAHPTSRLINERDSLDLDWLTLFDEIKKHDKILEINSQPERLDLPYDLVQEARKREIKLIISSDAHSIKTLDYMKYGISVAQRGWCKKEAIVNTLSQEAFLRIILG